MGFSEYKALSLPPSLVKEEKGGEGKEKRGKGRRKETDYFSNVSTSTLATSFTSNEMHKGDLCFLAHDSV
jgi:hypothetical protein